MRNIDPAIVGAEAPPLERSWTADEAILYALGVGAGVDELDVTTERRGADQLVLPTFAVIVGEGHDGLGAAVRTIGTFDPAALLHGEQAIELTRPIPPAGTVRVTARISAVHDKGSGALVVTESEGTDPRTGEVLVRLRSSAFVRGEGGFGGDRGPGPAVPPAPERAPDHTVTQPTTRDQALLYRLSGDRNPLHVDPEFARGGGFDQPILHGLCTYGFAGRALVATVADGDPRRVAGLEGRFTSPVTPGETLTTDVWRTAPDTALFAVRVDDRTVIDRGRVRLRRTSGA